MGLNDLIGYLGIGAGGLLGASAYSALGDLGEDAFSYDPETGEYKGAAADIAGDIADMGAFTGYGVTSGSGSTANVDADGNLSLTLSPEEAAQQDQLLSGASGFFSQAQQGIGSATNDIYESMRATMRPQEERDSLALEERLAAQGRTGVRTAQYGGTPEQLALAKAQEEAKNSAMFQARGQALGEQAQSANLGSMFQQAGYMPQAALLDAFGAGGQGYGFYDVANRQNQSAVGEALFSGLNASLGARLGQSNLLGNLAGGLTTGGFGFLSQLLG